MRTLFSSLIVLVSLLTISCQAEEKKVIKVAKDPKEIGMDFSVLKEGVRGYRNLSNTPDAPQVVFTNQLGEEVTLADFKGKTVLLNLWATWCPPCIREMPALNELAKEFKDKNFIVLAIATGRQGREGADRFLKKRKLTDLISYHDRNQNFLHLMDMDTLPVSFIIAPDGKMQGGVVGMTEWDTPEAKTVFRQLLNH